MDKNLTNQEPYIIFTSNNSTLIVSKISVLSIQNIVTHSGHCLKYSIENLLTESELKILAPKKQRENDFFDQNSPQQPNGGQSESNKTPEAVLRMNFKIKEFFGNKNPN